MTTLQKRLRTKRAYWKKGGTVCGNCVHLAFAAGRGARKCYRPQGIELHNGSHQRPAACGLRQFIYCIAQVAKQNVKSVCATCRGILKGWLFSKIGAFLPKLLASVATTMSRNEAIAVVASKRFLPSRCLDNAMQQSINGKRVRWVEESFLPALATDFVPASRERRGELRRPSPRNVPAHRVARVLGAIRDVEESRAIFVVQEKANAFFRK